MGREPRSTLFPYTTLFRSHPHHQRGRPSPRGDDGAARPRLRRSEEHTSELQSHVNLVCRLLLEKKKSKLYHRFKYPGSPNKLPPNGEPPLLTCTSADPQPV